VSADRGCKTRRPFRPVPVFVASGNEKVQQHIRIIASVSNKSLLANV
jgi:hypothetical protein